MLTSEQEIRPDRLVLRTDNETVANQLNGRWAVSDMALYHGAATNLIGQLRMLGVRVEVEKVSEKHREHRLAHRMSRAAWN